MIRLEKDKTIMEVCTEVQASAFLKSGWKKVELKTEPNPTPTKRRKNEKNLDFE